MDNQGAVMPSDTNEKAVNIEVAESSRPDENVNDIQKQDTSFAEEVLQGYTQNPSNGKDGEQKEASHHSVPEISMEASFNPDDVVRAGGFGARDDLSSVLPIASDSTDFESSLLGMREYEEPQAEKHRPGLGVYRALALMHLPGNGNLFF